MFLHFFTQHLLIFLQSVSKHTSIAYTFQSWYLSFAKPLVLGPETMGFRLWNPWFYNMKPMLSDCNLMGFRNRFRYCINIQNGSPTPAPRWEQPHPQPLPAGEGSEYPCFLLEDGARRPPSYCGYPILILTAKRGLGYLNSRPGSPCPGLQHPNKQPPPRPAGEGSGI